MLLLEATNLTYEYGDRTLFHIERLAVHRGERIGLIGRNGTGKTTLLELLAGRREPREGSIRLRARSQFIPQLKPGTSTMSGGEASLQAVSTALHADSELLLADEPTVHLDGERIEQLAGRFTAFEGAMIVISHDRAFLDRVCTQIWLLEDTKIYVYKGGYSDYAKERGMQRKRQQEQYEAYVQEKSRLEEAAASKKQKANRMTKVPKGTNRKETEHMDIAKGKAQKAMHRAVKAIETRLSKLDKVEKPREPERVVMTVPGAEAMRGSHTVIRVEDLSGSVEGRTLYGGASFSIKAGRKAALIGPNGCGKTTLLNTIVAGGPGVFTAGQARIGFCSQHMETLELDRTVWDNAVSTAVQPENVIRAVLARLLFKRDDVYKQAGLLSGGERMKAAFAKLLVSDVNVIMMDEPGNYLDLPSIEGLELLVKEYPGTILFVSHDQMFVERVADHILEIRNGQIISYEGTLAEYRERETNTQGSSSRHTAEELMRIERQLTETISLMSVPQPKVRPGSSDQQTAELQERFEQLVEKRKQLRLLLKL